MISLFENEEFEKLNIISSSLHNYPDFLIGKYECNPKEFWDLHISFYKKKFNDSFLDNYKERFFNYYNIS
jgi:hypothetical protein